MEAWFFNAHLGNDAEVRTTTSGVPVCNFRVAIKRGWGEHERTEWVSCAWFGERAEKCANWLRKGRLVAISGVPEASAWAKRDGSGVAAGLNCRVERLDFLGKATDDAERTETTTVPGGSDAQDQDVPF